MNFTLLFFLCAISSLIQINQSIDCNLVNKNNLIMNSLNGKILGECSNVDLFFNQKPKKTLSIVSWNSVPYAEPPVGQLRFRNPVPVKSWPNTVKNAVNKPNNCIQYEQDDETTNSEDCLYLSIDTKYDSYEKAVLKKNKSALLPVFVWIHGGGFTLGSVNEYDGSFMAGMSNVVSVRINYRLGPFGWMRINGTEAKGNQAILDQHLALKWIYENAERFGGNKERITICGESAGSWSVGYHLLYKPSWPYFRNAILQSGVPSRLDYETLLLTTAEATKEAKRIGSILGCNQKINEKLLECLQKVSNTKILSTFLDEITYPQFVMDSNVIFDKHPKVLMQKGEFKRTNIIVGNTNFEEALLADSEVGEFLKGMKNGNLASLKNALKKRLSTDDQTVNRIIKHYIPAQGVTNYYKYFVNMISDFQYQCPTVEFAENFSKYNNESTFVYLYAQKPSKSSYKEFDGATHGDEIDMMFGIPLMDASSFTYAEKRLSEQMVEMWTQFVESDRPDLDGEWEKFRDVDLANLRNVFYLKDQNVKNINVKLDNPTCKLWNDLNLIYWGL